MVFSCCEDVAKDRNTRGTSSMDCRERGSHVSHTVYLAHGNSKDEKRGRSRQE